VSPVLEDADSTCEGNRGGGGDGDGSGVDGDGDGNCDGGGGGEHVLVGDNEVEATNGVDFVGVVGVVAVVDGGGGGDEVVGEDHSDIDEEAVLFMQM
jgi:hypothetical protein